jgi:hypothetical protein
MTVAAMLWLATRAEAQDTIVRLPPTTPTPAARSRYSSSQIRTYGDAPTTPTLVGSAGPGNKQILLSGETSIYTSPEYLAALNRRQSNTQAGPTNSNGNTDTSGDDDDSWPNISQPGPDMGDFPNSAFTLPKGGAQVEFSPVTLLKADRQNPNAYATPLLLRYGVTDNVEFRMLGFGLTSVGGPNPTTGVGPPKLDMKVHLWDARKQWLLPAASLEVYVTTAWGSRPFNSGWQPSINMNFDLPITKKLNFEWTVGYGGVQQAININTGEVFVPRFGFLVPGIHREFNLNFDQFSVSWAFEYEVTERLAFFFHGAHNGAIALNLGEGDIIGQGMFWKFNRRLVAFGSINEGLTPNLPPVAAQIGFAYAL